MLCLPAGGGGPGGARARAAHGGAGGARARAGRALPRPAAPHRVPRRRVRRRGALRPLPGALEARARAAPAQRGHYLWDTHTLLGNQTTGFNHFSFFLSIS